MRLKFSAQVSYEIRIFKKKINSMKVRKEIKIDDGLLAALVALAKTDGRNVSNFIIKILTDFIEIKKNANNNTKI